MGLACWAGVGPSGTGRPAGRRSERCAMAQLYMEYAHGLRSQGSGLCGRMGSSIRILPESLRICTTGTIEARYSGVRVGV